MPRVEWAPLSVTPSSWLSWRYSPGHWRPLPRPHWDGYHSRSPPSITTEVTARAKTARSCLGLVLTRRAWLPLGHMQGGSHCLSHAVERERARWPQRVLGRGHGLEGTSVPDLRSGRGPGTGAQLVHAERGAHAGPALRGHVHQHPRCPPIHARDDAVRPCRTSGLFRLVSRITLLLNLERVRGSEHAAPARRTRPKLCKDAHQWASA